ncbi:sulfurtransferase complex subunit TusB [Cellvibrio mixtus]|uniref:sulfurtransferase complex subunit TusB n=1 Tax=Cellvibrio mixtus TaxID=39650 RepID=UPI000586C180|nr:sulfurtransferase complex subunit TusB [Cellvibrio mixtus]
MSTLHTVNKSSFTNRALESCILICRSSDGILLLEDGVFSALKSAPNATALEALNQQGIHIYALLNDVKARALEYKIAAHIQLISYDEFVSLTVNFNRVQSWY